MQHAASLRSSLQSGFYSIFKPYGEPAASHQAQRFFGSLGFLGCDKNRLLLRNSFDTPAMVEKFGHQVARAKQS